MIIKKVDILSYQLPTIKPVNIKGRTVRFREGIIIQIRTADGRISLGETAPLPGLHRENIQEVQNQLVALQDRLRGSIIPPENSLSEYLNTFLAGSGWLPSVRYGIESAIYYWYLHYSSKTQENHYLPQRQDKVAVNILTDGNLSDILQTIAAGLNEGYRAVKVKVGRLPAEEETKRIKSISRALKGQATLRLDANQAWDLDTAEFFLNAVKDCDIEYIEEPLKNVSDLPTLYARTGIPLAIDENLAAMPLNTLAEQDWIDTIVIKPAVMGSVVTSIQYIEAARNLNLGCVVSDTFHSGVGLSFLVRLASACSREIPMGFDTYRYMKMDVLKSRLKIDGGYYRLKDMVISVKDIDYSRLKDVTGHLSDEKPVYN